MVQNDLEIIDVDWMIFNLTQILANIQNYLNQARLVFGSDIIFGEEETESIFEQIELMEFELKPEINLFRRTVEKSIITKKEASYIEINLDISPALKYSEKYQSIFLILLNLVNRINSGISKIQSELAEGNYDEIIKRLEIKKSDVEKKLIRLKENEACIAWENHYDEIKARSKKIKELSKKLDDDQEAYLAEYFDTIDRLFRKFGGRNYKIERGDTNNKGYKKVFGIRVYFKGVNINSNNSTGSFFSESDKRALALAVFMAKITNMPDNQKKEIIVVLDDPITSFDENRIKIVVNSLSDIVQTIDQLFVLTHHLSFAEKLYLANKDLIHSYIIKRINSSSHGIFDMDPEDEFGSELSKAFKKILEFNNSESDDLTGNDLRVFLEEYLNNIFVKQIQDNGLDKKQFGERIDELIGLGVISKTAGKKLHSFRKELNSGSHTFQSSTIEDDRNFSIEIIDYLFNHIKCE